MASDISLAVGDGARRMTYAELADVRGISAMSAERLARRRRWPRQVGNDGVVGVLVPLSEARKSTRRTTVVRTRVSSRTSPLISAPDAPRYPDTGKRVRTLETAVDSLRDRLAKADQWAQGERDRADQAERQLVEERRRVDDLYTQLADARTAAVISGADAAALRTQLAVLTERRPWWRRWFR